MIDLKLTNAKYPSTRTVHRLHVRFDIHFIAFISTLSFVLKHSYSTRVLLLHSSLLFFHLFSESKLYQSVKKCPNE